jgi:hypothetical protein
MSQFKSNYQILKDYNIVLEHHSGPIDVESFINFKHKLSLHTDFKPDLKYFVNLQNVTFDITKNDIHEYANFLGTNSNIFGERQVALITSTPNQVVNTTLFKFTNQMKSHAIEIFSTYETAFDWLDIKNLSFNEFQFLIENLEPAKVFI